MLLLDEDVDDVVHGHEPDDAPVLLQHGHGQQVVLRYLVRHRLLIVQGVHRDGLPPHDLGDGPVQLRHHEVAQGEEPRSRPVPASST